MRPETAAAFVIADIAVVLAASSLLAAAVRRLRQPAVIGQILAGIMLGPTVLGRLPGHLSARLFPPAVLPYLSVLAQVAVVIFMFIVGYELQLRQLQGRRRAVLLVAVAAFAVPLGMGAGTAKLLLPVLAVGRAGSGGPFLLFMGVATAVTALPVLAAVARERGLAGTAAGVTATAAAGLMDVAAWLVLAAALAWAAPGGRPWPVTLLLAAAFTAVMLLGVRPALCWWRRRAGALLAVQAPVAATLALGSAWVTASLGLHPIFGGFLAGLTMRGRTEAADADVLRSMTGASGLLLPVFFAVTGLSLDIGSLSGGDLLALAAVTAVAIAGKLGPAYLGARLGGLPPRESAATATLLSTRGLTELIALGVGLQAGLIGGRLYAILVLMALITTVMTGPLLTAIRLPGPASARAAAPAPAPGEPDPAVPVRGWRRRG